MCQESHLGGHFYCPGWVIMVRWMSLCRPTDDLMSLINPQNDLIWHFFIFRAKDKHEANLTRFSPFLRLKISFSLPDSMFLFVERNKIC